MAKGGRKERREEGYRREKERGDRRKEETREKGEGKKAIRA